MEDNRNTNNQGGQNRTGGHPGSTGSQASGGNSSDRTPGSSQGGSQGGSKSNESSNSNR